MMKPYPKWLTKLTFFALGTLAVVSFFLGFLLYRHADSFIFWFVFISYVIGICIGILWGRYVAMIKYGGIAIKPEDIKNGLYKVRDILNGNSPMMFRTIILSPFGTDFVYHVSDSFSNFIKDDSYIGKLITIKDGIIAHVSYDHYC